MLKVRVIPCLDVRDGRVVKGVRFQNLRDSGDPVEAAARYEAEGADELVILDVSATPEGRGHQRETVRAVRAVLSVPLTVGGGVRSTEDARALLDAGADKVGVNTAAVRDPQLLTRMAEEFGRQCTVIAIDAARRLGADGQPDEARGWEIIVTSGRERTGRDAVEWAADAERRGAGEILLTSWDRDGTKLGFDVDLIAAVAERVSCPIIASGGVAHPLHMAEGAEAGATAVLAASIFHERTHSVAEVKSVMASRGIPIRGAAKEGPST